MDNLFQNIEDSELEGIGKFIVNIRTEFKKEVNARYGIRTLIQKQGFKK